VLVLRRERMHRLRIIPILLVSTMMAGGVAACTPTETAAPNAGAEQAAEESAPAEEQAEGAAPEEEAAAGVPESVDLGVVEIAAGEPIRIASLFVMTGPDDVLGEDSLDGMSIAIDDFGRILDHEVELLAEDTHCTPKGGRIAASKVAADPTIAGVVGTTCSSAAEAAIPIVTEAGLVMISPSNTAPGLTAPDRPEMYAGYLRTALNDLVQGRVAAEFAFSEMGLTRAATIHDESSYAEQLQKVFAEVFTELGGEVIAQEAVNRGDTEMGPVLESIAAVAPDVIYYPVFTAEGGLITAAARDVVGLEETVLMGADGLFSEDFVQAAGDAAAGMYLSGPHVAGERYEAFLAKFHEKFDRGPLSGYHAHAYDAAMIILNAIAAVAEDDGAGNLTIDRAALRDAVYATEGYDGLTGTLTCQSEGFPGDCATGEALAVYQMSEDTVAGEWPPPVVYEP
jgi:branched-chain amino acid transport system substrate-binding protein